MKQKLVLHTIMPFSSSYVLTRAADSDILQVRTGPILRSLVVALQHRLLRPSAEEIVPQDGSGPGAKSTVGHCSCICIL